MALLSDIYLFNIAFLMAVISVVFVTLTFPDIFGLITKKLDIREQNATTHVDETIDNIVQSEAEVNIGESNPEIAEEPLKFSEIRIDDGLSFAFRDIRTIPTHIANDAEAKDIKKLDFTECGVRYSF